MFKQLATVIVMVCVMTAATVTTTSAADADPHPTKVLGKHLWMIEARAAAGVKIPPEAFKAHLMHQIELEKAGILFAAGPVATPGEANFSMILIRAASREEAQKIADSDPLHQAKLRTYVLRDWTINEGRINVQLNFSDGSYSFE